MRTIVCRHCGSRVIRNSKLKHLEQHYCSNAECQHSRRLSFARKKYQSNQDFRTAKLKKVTERRKRKGTRPSYSDYQRSYRASHPEYAAGNRLKQQARYKGKKLEKRLEGKIVNPYTLMSQSIDNERVYAMFEIDYKKIVNPYTLMPETIDNLLITDTKPVIVKLL
jgi:hypothetical protein